MPESEEQRRERKERADKVKTGQSPFFKDLATPGVSGIPRAKKANQRGAGAAPTGPGSRSEQRSTEDHIDAFTSSPQDVSAVPGSPWGLYTHFKKVVCQKYPKAHLSGHNKKLLAWGKWLHQNFNPIELYEMIQVLVLDYESFKIAKVFMKFGGTPHPTFEQYFSNASILASFIGVGVISPPAVRRSPYADDYAKRHGKTASDSGVEDPVDPIKALRDKVNKTNK